MWLEALRSGKYKQGKEKLRQRDKVSHRHVYCCLGVLCDLYIQEVGGIAWTKDGRLDEDGDFLPKCVRNWAKLPSSPTVKHNGKVWALADINDQLDMPFPAIAYIIEEMM